MAGPPADAGKGKTPGEAAEQYRLQRHVVDDVGPLGPVEPGDRGDRPGGGERAVAAAAPGERAQGETLAADLRAMGANPGGDDDIEPGVARRPRHRQAVRAEIPILGRQKE